MTDRPDLAAYEGAFQRVFTAIDAGHDRRQPWLEQVREGLSAIVDLFAANPVLAQTVMVETMAAGPEVRRLREEAIARLAERLGPGPDPPPPGERPANISTMAAGAVSGLISEEVAGGQAAQLPDRFPELLFTLLVPFLGPQAAAAEMRRAADQRGA